MKAIRFIDSAYNTKFEIPDGGAILIKTDRHKKVYRCHYLDAYHFQISNSIFHICQFAEIMERNGTTYEPADIDHQ